MCHLVESETVACGVHASHGAFALWYVGWTTTVHVRVLDIACRVPGEKRFGRGRDSTTHSLQPPRHAAHARPGVAQPILHIL